MVPSSLIVERRGMIRIIPKKERHHSDFGWLDTYWLFSFSDYYDRNNVQFGSLRVFNDDIVAPRTGFPSHPHREMEIITIVLSGEIAHQDSMGNWSVIRAGDVQRMSAGTGLTHSEYNLSDKSVHFYQIWIYPDRPGGAPSYDQRSFTSEQWSNKLLPVASGQGLAGAVTFDADATIYRADLASGKELSFQTGADRAVFIYLTSGALRVNGEILRSNDQARFEPEGVINLRAKKDASLILIDVPAGAS